MGWYGGARVRVLCLCAFQWRLYIVFFPAASAVLDLAAWRHVCLQPPMALVQCFIGDAVFVTFGNNIPAVMVQSVAVGFLNSSSIAPLYVL